MSDISEDSMTSVLCRLFVISGFLLFAQAFSISPLLSQPAGKFAIIGYYRDHGADLAKFDLDRLTHICYSFLHLKDHRLFMYGHRDSVNLRSLVSQKKNHPALKVMISFGGWGGCEPCSRTFATPEGRRTFAESARSLLQSFGADGLDVDWEYPAVEGYPEHRYAPEDKENFTLLMKELRAAFGQTYELSFAAGAFTECLRASVDWPGVMPYVDRVHLMTYDFVNGYSTTTGHHTPLYSSPRQQESTDRAVRFLDSVGVPRSQVVIGAAFYARVWENVPDANNGLYQSGKFSRYLMYHDFDTFFGAGGFTCHWDSIALAPYRYSKEKQLFATYDDIQSVSLKTHYALERSLGGIMFWELTADTDKDGLLEAITSAQKLHQR
jgi:chitinase